jgi:hypothetical protein
MLARPLAAGGPVRKGGGRRMRHLSTLQALRIAPEKWKRKRYEHQDLAPR